MTEALAGVLAPARARTPLLRKGAPEDVYHQYRS